MSSYEELSYLHEIEKQLTGMQEAIEKMEQVAGLFNLESKTVAKLAMQAQNIKNQLFLDVDTIQEIEDRAHLPRNGDSRTLRSMKEDIIKQVEGYQKEFLPAYQKMVKQLLDNKIEIEKKVAEKRKTEEDVPSEGETKKALEDAEKKFQEAVKEESRIQRAVASVKSFVERAKPYIEPLMAAAKIILKLL